jgi:carboxyl-terminal processing protease
MPWRWTSRWQSACLSLLLIAALFSTARSQAPSTAPSNAPTADLQATLEQGLKLERDRRWGEALQHYEQAIKQYPERRELEDRLILARSHYDVARRYGDDSYVACVREMSEREALKLLGEVLEKVQTHYVAPPNWTELVRRGTTSFEVALTEEGFQKRHLEGVAPENVERFRREFLQTAATLGPRDVDQVSQCAAWAGKVASERLGVSSSAVIMEYVCGAVASLDEYSSFLTSGQLDEVFSQIEGNFVGLGVELKSEESALLVVSVIAGGPAAKSGLVAGDRIVAVDGQALTELSPDSAADLLRGEEGTQVEIMLRRAEGEARSMLLTRQRVEVPCVEGVKIVDAQNGIGYLKLNSFQKTTPRDVDAALWKLHREGMRSVIIDLRGNPGGLLNAAVELADKFIYDGPIVTTRGRNPREDYSYTAHTVGTWRVPLVVLIDGDSASASEIFAGAIRDRQRGLVVGERSYGKGSVQGIFPLASSKGGVRLTTAKFFSPSGQAIARNGVTPDVLIRTTARPLNDDRGGLLATAEDSILNAGLQVARDQLSKR